MLCKKKNQHILMRRYVHDRSRRQRNLLPHHNAKESGMGLPHTKTLAHITTAHFIREVMECGSPKPLLPNWTDVQPCSVAHVSFPLEIAI
jgi:hypothetical protein